MLIKQKSPSLTRNLALQSFGKLPIVFSTKVNLLYLLYSVARRCCLLHLIKQKLFAENFSEDSNHDDSGIFLPVFPFRANLKLHNITSKMVKKVITNLDLSKASGPDCIPVVVLKNCEPELFYILAEFFNKCLKKTFFQIVGRFGRWSLYLRMLGKSLQLKTTALLVFFLCLVKSLKNL